MSRHLFPARLEADTTKDIVRVLRFLADKLGAVGNGTRRIANSPGLLLMLFATTMLVASFLYTVSEGASFPNAVYWSLVTSTTLGYGDFTPHSSFGKVLTSCLITFTVFVMIPTITANVAAWLIVNRDAFTHEEQEEIKAGVAEILARIKDAA